jgi:hypothetical protein
MDEFCPQKGVEHALDHICDSLDSVASGIYLWLHDGWSHSYPAGHCHHRLADPSYSGTKMIIPVWIIAGVGKVFGKEDGQRVRKDFAKTYPTVRRKGFATNQFTTNL